MLPGAHRRFELAHAAVGSARDYWRGPDHDDEQHVRIEKDIPVGRQTLPAKLGREKARNAYHALVVAWLAAIMVL